MFAIAEITIKKLREPAFFLMLCLCVLLGWLVADLEPIASQISSDSLLSHLIVENTSNPPVLSSTFLAFIVSALLACFSGAAEIPRDISTGQIQFFLSKPVSKTGYMFGKYLGVLVTCLVFFFAMEFSVIFSHGFAGGEAFTAQLILRQFHLAFAFVPFVAIVIAFSCFTGDIAAIILTVLYLLFSMLFNFIPILIAMLPRGFAGDVENYIYVLYYFFPNYIFYFLDYRFFGVVFLALVVYSFSIAAVFLMIAAYRLNHMDFTIKS